MNKNVIVLSCVGVLLAGAVVALLVASGTLGGSNGTPPDPSERDSSNGLREEAFRLQASKQWCEAEEKWKELLDSLPEGEDAFADREEAGRNLEIVVRQCRPTDPRVPNIEISEENIPEDKRPQPVEERALLDYYPQGRKTRSVMLLNVTGRGVDRGSFLKGESHFAYQYRVAGESTVQENNGARLVFEQSFLDVVQLKANSTSTIELALPEHPILNRIFETLDAALVLNPQYRIVRQAWKAIDKLDPKLQGTLTRGKDALEHFGWKIDAGNDVDLIEQVERLSGQTFEMEYVSGLGVTHIRVVKGQMMEAADLERLAFGSSLLLDYYVFPAANKQIGETWKVRAEDVSGLVDFGMDTTASGELELKREADEVDNDGRPNAVLRVVGGAVDFDAPLDERVQQVRARPIVGKGELGTLDFLLKDRIVRQARFDWDVTTLWQGQRHLLSTLTKTRDVKVQSYYEAERIEPSTAAVKQP